MHARTRLGAALLGAAALAACVHKQETPSITGPSELGTSITVSVSPDVLSQDGASQSLVTITARNNNGQPLANLSLRTDISVGGAVTDFGRLSARNVVTDATGRATVTYTAPPAPAIVLGTGTLVDIVVTPQGTNADNSNTRVASIRLVPPGVIPPPVSSLKPSFSAPPSSVGDTVVFQANVVDATGADASSQVASFQWSFGDGGTANGRNVTHVFTKAGTFPVTLTITDNLGRTDSVTQSMTVGQGQLPTATFVVSPASPIVDQQIFFNALGSQAAPGHNITDYAWTFGDGAVAGGAQPQHSYSQAGSYTVTLQVTDDAGRKSTLTAQTITVGNGNPTADFTFSPSAPTSGTQVTFDASPSQAFAGRTIVNYSWAFQTANANPTSGTGRTVTTTFTLPAGSTTSQTFNVLLTVTDSAGKTSSITKPITINP